MQSASQTSDRPLRQENQAIREAVQRACRTNSKAITYALWRNTFKSTDAKLLSAFLINTRAIT